MVLILSVLSALPSLAAGKFRQQTQTHKKLPGLSCTINHLAAFAPANSGQNSHHCVLASGEKGNWPLSSGRHQSSGGGAQQCVIRTLKKAEQHGSALSKRKISRRASS
jgi:hypothetical protein